MTIAPADDVQTRCLGQNRGFSLELRRPGRATATVRLLHLAFLGIRFLTAAIHDDQSTEAVNQRRKHANEIADICHNLTSWTHPTSTDIPMFLQPTYPSSPADSDPVVVNLAEHRPTLSDSQVSSASSQRGGAG